MYCKNFFKKLVTILCLGNEQESGFPESRTSVAGKDAHLPGDSAKISPSAQQQCEILDGVIEDLSVDSSSSSHSRGMCLGIYDARVQGIYEPHSGTTDDNIITKVSSQSSSENISFTDGDDPYMYAVKSRMDKTRRMQDTGSDQLSDFFSRPLKISESEWLVNSPLNVTIDPWTLFLENPRVANRMANYNLLRAKLHVKVLINGNSFHYGRAMALYHPQHTRDDFTDLGSVVSLVQGSQMPHVFLNPTTSTGGELCLPFFCETNNVNLVNEEYPNLGRLHLISLNNLRHANGAVDQATVTVFAWLEDVELNMLTSVDMPALTPQSGLEVDEANNKGFVSGPATVMSSKLALLSRAPIIGPYAMATSKFAAATASLAKLFGYSRPLVTKDPEPYKPTMVSSLATTTVPDGAAKLTVDDKQELTVDPTIAGIGPGDPMNIKQIAMRESYLTTFDWLTGTSPESRLWNARVMPTLWNIDTGTSGIYLPACAMAAVPFKYWTGTMKFRFQIVASAFHKGRIKVVYDPNFMESNEYNTNFLEIVDISEKQDFTIEVGIGQNKSLLTSSVPSGLPFSAYGTSQLLSSPVGNGILSVYVVNELTTPDTSAPRDISINVFVSMGDDFEVFVPDNRFQAYTFRPQSGMEVMSESEPNNKESPPQSPQVDYLAIGNAYDSDLNKVFVGETIASFRPMLKRYALHTTIGTRGGAAPQYTIAMRRTAFPYLKGNVEGAIDSTIVSAPFNYCNTMLSHWVTLAYSGYRGSMRWKIIPLNTIDPRCLPHMSVERSISNLHYRYEESVTPSSGTTSSNAAFSVSNPFADPPSATKCLSGVQGMAVSNWFVNPNMEFEIPFYSQDRFIPGKREDYSSPAAPFDDQLNVWDLRLSVSTTVRPSFFGLYSAVGEDFQTYFWTGLPPIYYEPASPLPDDGV